MKFKSSGIKAKRPLEQIQKTQGVLHGFSRKSNEDEFSRKSNGGRIFMGIEWGLQNNNNNNMIRLVPARI